MADNDDKIKISELDPALTLDNTSETVVNKQVSGSWVTFKMTIATLAAHILEAFASSSLTTTNKTVVGAINELQQGGGGGGSSTLAGLTDVNLTSPSNDQVLKYDSASEKWINSSGGGGGGSSTLAGLTDVNLTSPSNDQVLKYDSASGKWINSSVNHYSETEKVVGTWIDGSPIYERVFVFSTPLEIASNVWATTNISNSNIDTIVNGWGINISGSNWGFLGFSADTGNYVQILNVRNAPISLQTVILRYTKSST